MRITTRQKKYGYWHWEIKQRRMNGTENTGDKKQTKRERNVDMVESAMDGQKTRLLSPLAQCEGTALEGSGDQKQSRDGQS